MHWNTGKFHENITVGKKIYITDHKHLAVYGDKKTVKFGTDDTNTSVYGCINNINALDYLRIQSGNKDNLSSSMRGIGIISNNGSVVIASGNTPSDDILNDKNKYIIFHTDKGIVINKKNAQGNDINYGTTLPISGTEGQIFFKLIS